MKLIKPLNLFLNNQSTLWNLVESLTEIELLEDKKIHLEKAIKYINNNESDKGLIATVLLWSIKDSPVGANNDGSNSFINFLNTIRDKSSNFFNEPINWIYTNNNTCTYEKDNLLFIINDNSETTRMQLPDTYCDKTVMCLNCNEEIKVSYFIDVPANTFYIIEIAE